MCVFFAFRKVGGGEVPVRLVPAQLSSGAWLPTMELCLNAAHFRPATQQECTDAVIEALEAGMPFEIPGGEDEDDGEGEGDDNDGAEDDVDEFDYWSHGIGKSHKQALVATIKRSGR